MLHISEAQLSSLAHVRGSLRPRRQSSDRGAPVIEDSWAVCSQDIANIHVCLQSGFYAFHIDCLELVKPVRPHRQVKLSSGLW